MEPIFLTWKPASWKLLAEVYIHSFKLHSLCFMTSPSKIFMKIQRRFLSIFHIALLPKTTLFFRILHKKCDKFSSVLVSLFIKHISWNWYNVGYFTAVLIVYFNNVFNTPPFIVENYFKMQRVLWCYQTFIKLKFPYIV